MFLIPRIKEKKDIKRAVIYHSLGMKHFCT